MEAARRHGRVVPLARAGGDGPPDGRVFDGPGALEGRPNQQELPRLRGERVLDVVRRARFTRVDDAAVTRANEVLGAAEPELHRHVGVARVVLGEEEPVELVDLRGGVLLRREQGAAVQDGRSQARRDRVGREPERAHVLELAGRVEDRRELAREAQASPIETQRHGRVPAARPQL